MKHEKITPVPVERDENGYWVHPYLKLPSSKQVNDFTPFGEWLRMATEANMDMSVTHFEYDAESYLHDRYFLAGDTDIHEWKPSAPIGKGWFIVSIHEDDFGPVCIWMRDL